MNNDNLNNNGQSSNNFNQMPGVNPQNNINQVTPDITIQPNINPTPQSIENYNMNSQPPKKTINKNTKIIIVAIIVIIAIVILFATGVIGSKKLTCTIEQSTMGIEMKQELNIQFKRNYVNKVVGKITVDYGDNAEYKDIFEESLKDELEDFKEDGITSEIKSNDTSMILTFKAEKDKLKDALGMYDNDGNSYKEVKEYFEDEGYTCK